ncbi:CoA transferase [Zhengella mangrovi]|uniref:CoA transferase n=1 Tax=Zhengella mangrovi TaxID=1982044 RepID=A0A2G1QPJ0_9HYPH|nr:CaiB/BaiF CoA-transferase family protein [Zhengella mangrovi]PHP67467.1 CoA transferase [Zhengella mangrovi]
MLAGVRIIEVEGLGPGPFCGMLMADLGADVIVVHRPDGSTAPGAPKQSLLDRGKRSIALDLKKDDDRAIFFDLVKTADGLIEGFRPGVMERLGVGPAECHAVRPALVYGRMTGWGQAGPRAMQAGHDLNYASLSGAAWYASPAGACPFTPPTVVGDIGGGALYLAIGLLSGILQARASGQGTVVDAAIVDGSAHMMNLLMSLKQAGGLAMERGRSLLDGPHWSRTYRTSDGGYFSVQSLEPKFYAILLEKLDLAEDPEFRHQFDKRLWPKLTQRLETLFASRTKAQWTEVFAGSDACAAPVHAPNEAMDDPHMAARGVWQAPGGVLQAAAAPRFDGRPATDMRPSPVRDGDRAAILAETGRG